MLSFIIPFHHSRLNNLLQTIRFLEYRENVENYELILVSQDSNEYIETKFKQTHHINIYSTNYHRAKMLNIGVGIASNSILVLLDSDRILPSQYFARNISLLKKKQIISTYKLYSLDKLYSDEEIQSNNIRKLPDFKSQDNVPLQKNAFAGNTIIRKEDYIPLDESYTGYGFLDNDAVKTAEMHGYIITFNEEEELHLYHRREIWMDEKLLLEDEVMQICALNGLKYCKKWQLDIPNELKKLLKTAIL